jgi:hypothetical protein
MSFALLILLIGFTVSGLGWAGLSMLLGLLLLANTHPAGWGWLYLGLMLVGAYIHHRLKAEQT